MHRLPVELRRGGVNAVERGETNTLGVPRPPFAGNGIVSFTRIFLSVRSLIIDIIAVFIDEVIYLVAVEILVIGVSDLEPYTLFGIIGYSRNFLSVRFFIIDGVPTAINAVVYIVAVCISDIHISVSRYHYLLEADVVRLKVFLLYIVADLVSAAVEAR